MAERRFIAATEGLRTRPMEGTAGYGPQGSLAGAEAGAAQAFSQLAAQTGAIADRGAIAAGEQAGAVAGASGDNILPEAGSLYGDAYRNSWFRTYAAKLDTDLYEKGFAVYEANKDSPSALAAGLAKLREDMTKEMVLPDPVAQATFEIKFRRVALGYQQDAARRADARVKDTERAASVQALAASSANVERQGYATGLDPKGIEATDAEAKNFYSMVDRAVAADAITPGNATVLKRKFDDGRAEAHVKGEFSRLPPDQRPAFVARLDDEFKAGKGLFKGMDFDSFERLKTDLQRGMHADTVQASKSAIQLDTRIKRTQKLFEEGFSPAPSEWSSLEVAAASVPNGPETIAALKADDALFARWRNMSPGEVEAELATERAKAATSGTDQVGARKLMAGEKFLANMRAELGRDPLGWAERTGIAQAPLIDFAAPDAGTAMQDRVAAAEAVAGRYGIRPVYLRPEEKQAIQVAAGMGGEAMTGVLGQIAAGFGTRAPRVLAEVSRDAPILAHIGGLVTGDTPSRAAADATTGIALKRDPAYKPHRYTSSENAAFETETAAVVGPAFLLAPKDGEAMEATARLIYEARVARGAYTPALKDNNAKDGWRRALNEAAGASFDAEGVQYGGFGSHDPNGIFNRAYKVVVPPAIQADRFTSVIDALRDGDLPQGAPSAAQVQQGHLVAVGSGRYEVALGDPGGDDPRWLTTAAGGRFVLDLNPLLPALRQRVPRAFRGGAR